MMNSKIQKAEDGKNAGSAKMLRNWLHRGYIEKEKSDSVTQKLSDSVYFKTHQNDKKNGLAYGNSCQANS